MSWGFRTNTLNSERQVGSAMGCGWGGGGGVQRAPEHVAGGQVHKMALKFSIPNRAFFSFN